MSVNLDALRSFVVLAEELHFGRAAKRLYVAQPTLTKQIQRLESELAVSLFTRTTGQVSLTSAGTVLLERAAELVRAGASFEGFAREASTGEVGTLRIGFGIATLSDLLPQSVIAYRAAFPKMRLEMQDMSSRAQMDALLEGSIDLGFVRMPVRHSKMKTLVVLREELLIAVAASGKHAATASLRDLRDEPFVLIGRSTSATYHSHALSLCALAGFQPNVVQEAKELFTVLSLVRAGLGVSLVPSTARRMRVPGVAFHPVRKTEARWDIAMAWRRDRERIVEPFAKLVRDTAKSAK
ncbi:LysR family transcriptional regulator [Terriglobus roseus]|uniref:Transcriptional regulator, LysR family n=1 Tax=Terriglobus roseus TaxID=392734 RepID=A0A1G7GFR5_9BACT|nr:LysR family transcriptional regulator [Terriglobus roseus]SDE86941.1 transcriptional regulator, LysR family [Terriglobus roseus]